MTTDNIGPESSLAEAIDWLYERIEEGVECPCCQQFTKVYRRKIHSCGAMGLITMFRQHGMDWGHAPSTPSIARIGGELARLRWWGLVEENQERRDDGGRAGWWRVTELGRSFVLNEVRVPKYSRVYDGILLGLDPTETVSIIEALGNKFNYREMMEGY